jgi:hypothetical protein
MLKLLAARVAVAACLVATPASADEMLVGDGDDLLEVEEEEEEKDEFGSEVLWVDARAGYTFMDMVTFDASNGLLTAGLIPTGAGGPSVAMGLGVRLWFVTLGPRVTLAMLHPDDRENFNVWSVDGEIGLRIPLGRVEPHLTFAVGYSALGGIDDAVAPIGDGFDIEGANLRLGLGLDVYITEYLSVGADVTGEVIALSRPGVPLEDVLEAKGVGTVNEAEAEILEADGASTGAAVSVLGGLGVHF